MPHSTTYLVTRSGGWLCAIPIGNVLETMRPLEMLPVAGLAKIVQGISLIRGKPTPVVYLSTLLSNFDGEPVLRLVTLRIAERCVALGVKEVLGIFDLNEKAIDAVEPLLQQAKADMLKSVGALDQQLLLVLDTVQLLSEDDWRALNLSEA